MSVKLKKFIILTAGWFFLFVGILGLVLPFIQGILFIILGLYLLSNQLQWAKNILNKIRNRYPVLFNKIKGIKMKFGR